MLQPSEGRIIDGLDSYSKKGGVGLNSERGLHLH